LAALTCILCLSRSSMIKVFQKRRKSRHWSSKNILPFVASYKWFNGSSWTTLSKTFAATSSRSGVSNAEWERLRDSGLDAGSNYSRYLRFKVLKNPPVDWTWTEWRSALRKGFFTYKVVGNFPMHQMRQDFNFAEPDVSALQTRAKLAFLSKIRDEQSPFKALPFLGELKETIAMLRNPLNGIRRHTLRYAGSVRRNAGRLKKAGHISDMLTDMYLQWTYGVAPLLNDIQSLKEAYSRLFDNTPVDIPLRVTVKDTVAGSDGVTVAPYSTVPVYIQNTWQSTARVQIKGALRYDVSRSRIGKAMDLSGFKLEEFIPTLWELCPYSFVFDYITNVGDVIGGACTSLAGLRWYWQSTGVIKRRVNFCVPGPSSGLSRTWPLDLAICALENRTFNRDKPSLSVSLRDFEFQLPSLDQEVKMAVLGFAALRRALD